MKTHKKIVGLLVATGVSFLLFSCSGGGGGGGGEAGEGGEGSSEQNNASNDKNNTSGGSTESKDYAPATGKLAPCTLTSSYETIYLGGYSQVKFSGQNWWYENGGYDYKKTGKNKGTLSLRDAYYRVTATSTMHLSRTGTVTFNSPTSVTWDHETTQWTTGGSNNMKHETSSCTTYQLKRN